MTKAIHRLHTIPWNILPISESRLRQLIKEGEIQTIKLGKRATGVSEQEIERFLKSKAQ